MAILQRQHGHDCGRQLAHVLAVLLRVETVTGSEIAEKFGVTLIEFNRVANGLTRGSGQIAQIVESEKWLNEDGICDRTFSLASKPKVVTPQGKSRLFTRRAIEQSQEGRRQECIARAARRRRLIAQGLYIDEMESIL
ncbi:regulator [Enterobacter hormaechei]